jgi:hypothetical protein
LAKPITEIIFNHTTARATLDFKDIVILAENSEYLKRMYKVKNAAGRNEIADRIQMLAGNPLVKQTSTKAQA